MKQQSKRASFIDVGFAQDKLRKYIDDCIEYNKPLDKNERNKFIKLLRDSTLGLGINYPFLYSGKLKTYDLNHVEHAAYWLAYKEKNPVRLGDEEIEIKNLWLKLRDNLFIIFPHAVTLGFKISQEQIRFGTAKAGKV